MLQMNRLGPLAQLAEQVTLNHKVAGSIPAWPTIKNTETQGFLDPVFFICIQFIICKIKYLWLNMRWF